MAVRNRDIVYVLRMRNEARAALRAYRGDLQSAAQATAEATRQAREMAKQARALDGAIRRTGQATTNIAANMNLATTALRSTNRELSRLANTSNASARIGQNMTAAATAVQSANNALRQLNSALNGFSRTAARTGILATNLTAGAQAVRGATVALRQATTQANGFARAAQSAGSALQGFNAAGRGGRGVSSGFKDMAAQLSHIRTTVLGVTAAVGGFMAGNKIFQMTDTFTAMNSQLRLVTKSNAELASTYESLFAMAQKTRQSLDGTVNLYARVRRSTQSLNMTQAETLELTEAINKSVAIFGGPAASAEAALYQLAQGFAAGALRGDELRSVLEQAPRLAQAIADGMGVAVGSLRTLAEQGKTSSENMVKALMSQRDRLEREFQQVGVTVSQAYTVAGNALLDYVGKTDKAAQTSQNFSRRIMDIAKMLRDPSYVQSGVRAMEIFGAVLQNSISAAKFLVDNIYLVIGAASGLAAAFAAPAIINAAKVLFGIAQMAILLATNFNRVNVAILATIARMRILQFMMSRSGIGLAVMAIGTAIGYWMTRTSETEDATNKLKEAVQKLKEGYDGTAGAIDKMTKAQKDAAAVAAQNAIIKTKPELASARQGISTGFSYTGIPDPAGATEEQKQKLREIIESSNAEFKKGEGGVQKYIDRLNALGAANPNLSPTIANLVDMAKGAADLEFNLEYAQATLAYLNKTATDAQLIMLGLKDAFDGTKRGVYAGSVALSAYTDALHKLMEMHPDGKRMVEQFDGITEATEKYNTAKTKLNDLLKSGEITMSDYRTELAAVEKAFKDAKDEASGLVDAVKELKKYQQETELGGIFNSRARAIAQEKRAYDELVESLKKAKNSEELLAKAQEDYNKRVANIEGQARYDLAKNLEDTLRGMADETRLIGLQGAARERMIAIIQAENAAREAQISNIDEFMTLFKERYDAIAKTLNEQRFAEDFGTQLGDLRKEAALLGVAADKQDRLNKLIDFENAAREAGIENADKYRKQFVEALDAVKMAQEQVNKNFGLGFGEGLREFGQEATNLRKQANDLAKGIAGDISGALKKAFRGEGFDLGEMLGDIGGRFLDTAIDNLVGNMAKQLGGMFDDGMQNDPVAKAQQIVAQQQDAYLMTVAGVERVGHDFITQLQAAFQGIVNGVNAVSGTPNAAGGGPDYSPGAVVKKALAEVSATGSGKGLQFSTNFNNQVDERLIKILDLAAQRTNLSVQATSGYRRGDPRFHGKGMATDVRLFDPATGKAFNNYQNGADFRVYEQFAQQAKLAQMQLYPELADKFRWGGYFSGRRGTYGALDTMHFDVAGAGMGGGSWEKGLTDKQRSFFPDATSVGMNMQQLQQQITQVGTAAQTAAQATRSVAQAHQTTGVNATTAAQAVNTMATNSTNAGQQIQTAGQQIAAAGQSAATAGQKAQTAGTGGMDMFAQGIGQLLGPLNQVVPGLGSFAQMILQLLSSMGSGGTGGGNILTSLFSLFSFSKGGIMGPNGALPLHTYSRGGVAKKPQLALFGEGRQNEAYVPLPDGKSIPVAMHGGGGGVNVGSIKIDVQMQGSSGNADMDRKHADNTVAQIDKMLDEKMGQWFLRQSGNGGMIDQSRRMKG